jgi:pyridinium-3,5-biscarboxylic acid mononucleotide sulfurtransferase
MGEQMSQLAALDSVLSAMGEVAVAVSGGVDSLTLAAFAHRMPGQCCVMYHAVSPAVPNEATQRTRALAEREGWTLHVIDAGEFGNADYMRNPVNRCFFCKTSLYGSIRPHTAVQIVSGTNLDDLGEYRPGLLAAQEHGVRHPFVEAGLRKNDVRALARQLGLGGVAELPASPCLSSRVETGIAIDPAVLALVHATEQLVAQAIAPKTVRCRVRAAGVVVELDAATLERLDRGEQDALRSRVGDLFAAGGHDRPVAFEPYRVGSAFLHFKVKANSQD